MLGYLTYGQGNNGLLGSATGKIMKSESRGELSCKMERTMSQQGTSMCMNTCIYTSSIYALSI